MNESTINSFYLNIYRTCDSTRNVFNILGIVSLEFPYNMNVKVKVKLRLSAPSAGIAEIE